MKCLHLGFQFPFSTSNSLIGTSQIRKFLIGVRKFLLSHATSAISLFKQSASLLKCILSCIGSTFIGKECITDAFLGSLLILKLSLGFSNLLVVFFYGFLGLLIGSISMFQSSFQFSNIRFKFLLHANCLSLTLAFSLKSCLHTINSLLEVFASAHKLLFLFSNTT